MLNSGMRILLIDIETAPNKAFAWGLFRETIPLARLIDSGYTICFAAKWYGDRDKDIVFKSVHHDGVGPMRDEAHRLLDEADLVIHYNGKSFDIPTLNAEFVRGGYAPPSPYFQLDLYHIVRATFRFPSNKLDYVVQELGLGKKLKHKGMELWAECMAGDEKSWGVMRRYNIMDVKVLERLYKRLLPWVRKHPNHGLWIKNLDKPVCPNCGSKKLQKRGFEHTRVLTYQRWHCGSCGSWSRSRKRIAPARDEVLT